MKVALLNDTHWGSRSDNDRIAEHQKKFYDDVFFPYLRENDIQDIFILGDAFERRKFINFKSLFQAREMFFEPAREFKLRISSGNHDEFHSNTSTVNALDLLLGEYTNITTYIHKPEEIKLGDLWIGVIPWITPENREQCLSFLKSTLCSIIFGHFDINGFEMNPGIECRNGEDPSIFERFEAVYSGHYHKKMDKGNIHYLGSQYDTDWNDYGVSKFFHVLDTETKTLTPILNPNRLFVKIHYKNGLVEKDVNIKGCFVKMVVLEKGDLKAYDKCVAMLKNQHPESFSTIENLMEGSVEDQVIKNRPIYTVIDEYINNIQSITDDHKQSVKVLLQDLYIEATATG